MLLSYQFWDHLEIRFSTAFLQSLRKGLDESLDLIPDLTVAIHLFFFRRPLFS